MPAQQTFRSEILARLGANGQQLAELLHYNQDGYEPLAMGAHISFPLANERFVSVWEHYARMVQRSGTFAIMARYLVQLRFPVGEGISRTEAYLSATRKGIMEQLPLPECGLQLVAPERCAIEIYSTPAGSIPLIVSGVREDFESLLRALTGRNEPALIPEAQGACMVAGYNNWHRILLAKRHFERTQDRSSTTWAQEFANLRQQKELFQDSFILLGDGPYSGVPGKELGFEDAEWLKLSLLIRREHEACHYFTRRILGRMRNNLRDELMADYFGIVAARGSYCKDWFLHFLGIHTEDWRHRNRRFINYRGSPPLSDEVLPILKLLIERAAENLEAFDCRQAGLLRREGVKPYTALAISALTLEELASEVGESLLTNIFLKIMDRASAS